VTSYPTVGEVIAVHARLIAKFGGSLGIRDHGALESALARPCVRWVRSAYNDVGASSKEIRIRDASGIYRVIYVATFEEAIYVLHLFLELGFRA
jgi:hypothetical protein